MDSLLLLLALVLLLGLLDLAAARFGTDSRGVGDSGGSRDDRW